MNKKIKLWISVFICVYLTVFIIFTKYHASVNKNDKKYDEIGLVLEKSVDKNIINARALKSSKYNGKEIKKQFSDSLNANVNTQKQINEYLSKSAKTQKTLNEAISNTDLTIKSISLNQNMKTVFYAIPFTIVTIKSDKYYPDEHVIIKKGQVGVDKYTVINKLVSESVINKPVTQYQFLGTKSYERLPNFEYEYTSDYEKQLLNKQIKTKEIVENPNAKEKYKKVFVSFNNVEQLSHVKINDTLDIKVKWLSKQEYDKKLIEKQEKEKFAKEISDAKAAAFDEITKLEFIDSNFKTGIFNKLNTLNSVKQINKVKDEAIAENKKEAAKNGVGTGKYVPPVQPAVITAGVGFHLANEGLNAVDFSPPGSYPGSHKITAADNGVVIQATYEGPYGNCVIIDHKNGFFTRYAHMNSFSVNVGDTVMAGDQLGWIGTTGNSTGTHVHFEIIKDKIGNTVDPRNYGIGY